MAEARPPDDLTSPKRKYSATSSRVAGIDDTGQSSSLLEKDFQLDGSLLTEQNDSIFENVLPKVKLPRLDWNTNQLKLEQTIGEGKFGAVYLVSNPEHNEIKMAFKQLKGANKKSKKLFAKELLLLDNLKHCNVIQIYKFSVNPIGLYQEYMVFDWNSFGADHRSHDLEDFMKTLHKLKGYAQYNEKASLSWNIALDVARGLDYLHGRGIVHRDLKLENILVSKKDAQSGQLLICKITDFGEARAIHIQTNTIARTGTIHVNRGTISYQAPDVILKKDDAVFDTLDLKRTDIWAFGVVLHFLLNPDQEHIFANNTGKTSQHDDFRSLLVKMMKIKTKPASSEEYLYLRKLFPAVDRVRSMCLVYVAQERPSTKEIIIELGNKSGAVRESYQANESKKMKHSIEMEHSTEMKHSTAIDRDGTFHPTDGTKEHCEAGQEMDSTDAVRRPSGPELLTTFQRTIAVHGLLISKLMDPDEVLDILYANTLFSRKDKEKADGCRYGSIEKSDVVLSVLKELPRDRLEVALNTLWNKNQKDLVNLLTGGKEPSEPSHWCVIRKNRTAMMDSLDPDWILISLLFQKEVLNDRDKDHVDKCTTTREKVGMILDILERKSESDFKEFMDCLYSLFQGHVADILEADCDI